MTPLYQERNIKKVTIIDKLNKIKVNTGFGIYLEKIKCNRIFFLKKSIYSFKSIHIAINKTGIVWIYFKQKEQRIQCKCNREDKFKCLS